MNGCSDWSVWQQCCPCQLSTLSNLRLGVRLRLAAVALQHLCSCMWAVHELQCSPSGGVPQKCAAGGAAQVSCDADALQGGGAQALAWQAVAQ